MEPLEPLAQVIIRACSPCVWGYKFQSRSQQRPAAAAASQQQQPPQSSLALSGQARRSQPAQRSQQHRRRHLVLNAPVLVICHRPSSCVTVTSPSLSSPSSSNVYPSSIAILARICVAASQKSPPRLWLLFHERVYVGRFGAWLRDLFAVHGRDARWRRVALHDNSLGA